MAGFLSMTGSLSTDGASPVRPRPILAGGTDDSFGDLWHRVLGHQALPPDWLVVVTGVIALALVLPHPAWRVTRTAVTIAHEGGHALVAVLTGRRLDGIRLHSDTSGLTVTRGKPHGFGMVLTAMAGYLAPALLGLGGAALLAANHVTALLWTAIMLLAAMLLRIRNAFGALAVLATGLLVFLVSWFTDSQVQAGFGYLAVWFLLLAAVRPVVELQGRRRGRGAVASDADQLGRLTGVPGGVWVLLFGAVALVCLATGASWLVP